MKQSLYLGLTLIGMIVVSCSLNQVEQPLELIGKTIPITITANQADGNETKTIRNVDKSVSWMPAEDILVICGDDKAKFTSTNTENLPTVSFNGELDEATVNAVNNGTSSYPVWGLYPYDENAESDGTTYVTTTLPANQTGVAGTFADELFITLAKSNDFNLFFYNVCSGFKFSVTKAGITSITIQGKSNEYLAGKVKLSFDGDGKPKVDEVLDGLKTITLTPENSTFEVGKDYYFVTLPTPFSSGFTVTFNTPSETGTFDVSSSVSFPRSKFVSKTAIDNDIAYAAKVGNINIPDAVFKAYCVEHFDTNDDDEISYVEALNATSITLGWGAGAQSLEGIEFFSNLLVLECPNSNLINLDVSKCTKLTELHCETNKLTSLNVRGCSALTTLVCSNNQLTNLNVSTCSKLLNFSCDGNQLTGLDVSDFSLLGTLYCSNNQISSLVLSGCSSLIWLDCNDNLLTSLDVSDCSSLEILQCYNNQLLELDLNDFKSLTSLKCDNNLLTSLSVCGCSALTNLQCDNNHLSSLIVSNCSSLTTLYCKSNQLPSLSMNGCSALTWLECHDNLLTSLDVSDCSSLTTLYCYSNQLPSLSMNGCSVLTWLDCHDNLLTSLDVSDCSELITLVCDENQLTSLDVSNCLVLDWLTCISNSASLVIWLKTGQIITVFNHDYSATINYKN